MSLSSEINTQKVSKKNIAIFATWSKEWWGSWARILLEKVESESIKANVKAIVTQYPNWWVANISDEFWWKWLVSHLLVQYDLPKTWENWQFSNEDKITITNFYNSIIKNNDLDFIFLSGWMKKVLWISPEKVINIHPWPIKSQWYWWKNMYWMNVHNKVWEDYKEWKINRTCVTMHYVTEKYDDGPILLQVPVSLDSCNSAEDVAKAVNKVEHDIQRKVTELVISWAIKWSGKKWESLKIINQKKIDDFNFPEWTVLWWIIELK